MAEDVWGKYFQFFLFSCMGRGGRDREEDASSCQTTSIPGEGGCPLDVILETLVWRRMFLYCLSGFESSKMLLVLLLLLRKSFQCLFADRVHPRASTHPILVQPVLSSNFFHGILCTL